MSTNTVQPACECMMTALHVVIVKLEPVRAVCVFIFCCEEHYTQQ